MTQTGTPEPPGSQPTGDEKRPDDTPARGPVKAHLFARTDVGRVREHNEDNFLVADLSRQTRSLTTDDRNVTIDKHGMLLAVCDGMGGAAAGEIASQLAVDILYEEMSQGLLPDNPLERDAIARRLVRAVEVAGYRIYEEAKADRSRRGMGTTVTAAALVDEYVFFAQVGDSRAYILRGEELVQVTRDQSLVNQLIEAGQLTEQEAETFEHNNIILQALGTADSVQVDLTYSRLVQGDTLLLCSDGLSGMIRGEEMRRVLLAHPDPFDACKTLTELANEAGGHDNITVVVAKFDGDGLVREATAEYGLKYQKYLLPEEPAEHTAQHVRPASLAPPDDDDDGEAYDDTMPITGTDLPPQARTTPQSEAPTAFEDAEFEERIEIPGTHVPSWMVVALVMGVVAVLGGTAFLFLR